MTEVIGFDKTQGHVLNGRRLRCSVALAWKDSPRLFAPRPPGRPAGRREARGVAATPKRRRRVEAAPASTRPCRRRKTQRPSLTSVGPSCSQASGPFPGRRTPTSTTPYLRPSATTECVSLSCACLAETAAGVRQREQRLSLRPGGGHHEQPPGRVGTRPARRVRIQGYASLPRLSAEGVFCRPPGTTTPESLRIRRR